MSRASANDPITRGYIEAEEKAERLRRSARLKQYHMEMQEREGLQKAEEEHLKRQRAVQREAALADALGRKKIAELREEKEVQRIREEAPELRALRQKLAAAQMNQQREMQLVQVRVCVSQAFASGAGVHPVCFGALLLTPSPSLPHSKSGWKNWVLKPFFFSPEVTSKRGG